MALNKKEIFALDDTKYKVVQVKAWNNAEVIIKTMSAAEKMQFVEAVDKSKNEIDTVLQLILICCVDDNHKQLFEKDDLPALKQKSSDALMQIAEECMKLSEMDPDAVEEAAKN